MTLLKMGKKHIKSTTQILSKVFKDDMKDVFPDLEERRVKEPLVNEYLVRRSYSVSQGYIISPRIEGIAIWRHSSNRINRSLWNLIISGAIWPALKIGRKALRKIEAFDKYMEKKHYELVPKEHWYLAVLAVEPQYQGKGYGGKLLNGMLSIIDKEGLSCYVETEGEKNVSLYQHFGFNAIDKFVVPDTTEKMVAMLREPKTQPKGGKK